MSVAGSLYGLAFGDAIGKPTEFRSVPEILSMYGPAGPRDLPGTGVALVTDDTQMALAVADALAATLEHGGDLTPARFEPRVRERFLSWLVDPENNRAPGFTCLNACRAMAGGASWLDATVIGSKGCGANMRVTPIALPPGISNDDRAGAAQLQAAMTHGHPTALAASELTMFAVRWLLDGTSLPDLPARLRDHCHARRLVYRDDWLGDLWLRARDPSATTQTSRRETPAGSRISRRETSAGSWISQGWDDCLAVLDRLDAALAHPDRDGDPCRHTGAGWIAEEALATALLCVLLFPDDPVAVLSRAAVTAGDSDSIAALAGACVGAVHPMSGWPTGWADRIEYGEDLRRLGGLWGG